MGISLADANKLCEAAIEKAGELGIKISVAVCDPGGRLVAFNRMDGAIWASVYGSQGKATTSVGFGRPSVQLQERADHPTIRGIIAASGSDMIPGQGAIPVIRRGVVLGACGVGGGTGEEDEVCAQAAVDAILPPVRELSIREAAELRGCSRPWIQHLCRRGRIKGAYQLPNRRWRIPVPVEVL